MVKNTIIPVAWLMLACAIIGVALAAAVHADPVADYTTTHARAVCLVLDTHPNDAGIEGIAQGIHDDGYSYRQAAAIIVDAVLARCPRHWPLIVAYTYGGPGVAA